MPTPRAYRPNGATTPIEQQPLAQRFWRKVAQVEGGCWEWQGMRNQHGYGRFNTRAEDGVIRPRVASRVSYELAWGPIPEGAEVRHRCDNPPCVNPAHLVLGTHGDNMRDMRQRRRSASGEEHSQARLTWTAVRKIRSALAVGSSRRSLAAEYGVSAATVDKVANNETWKPERDPRNQRQEGAIA